MLAYAHVDLAAKKSAANALLSVMPKKTPAIQAQSVSKNAPENREEIARFSALEELVTV